MTNNIKFNDTLKNDVENQENDKTLNILNFMHKYFDLYINTKKASNISKNSLTSINFILEKFLLLFLMNLPKMKH